MTRRGLKIAAWLLLALLSVAARAQLVNTTRNLVSNGDAEAGWADWYYAANATLAADGVDGSGQCFEFAPSIGMHSDVRTIDIPIDPCKALELRYAVKSLPGATMDPGSSYVQVRSWDAGGAFLGEDNLPLELTGGAWVQRTAAVSARAHAVKLDVRIIFGAFAGSATGTFRVDDVALYSKIGPLNHGLAAPGHLYVARRWSLSNAAFVALQTLQGIVAQTRPAILIDEGNQVWLDDLVSQYGLTYTRSDSLYYYVNRYRDRLSGYVLFDFNDPASLTAATSAAGVLRAMAVDVTLESQVQSWGLSRVLDLRGKDDAWVYQQYGDQFVKDALIVQHGDVDQFGASAYYFRDYGPAIRAASWFNSDPAATDAVYAAIHDNSPCYGWLDGSTENELHFVEKHSSYNMFQVPCDWMCNLSTFAGMAALMGDRDYQQKVQRGPYVPEDNVHYVALKMSDTDNILVHAAGNTWVNDARYYGHPQRGTFPMGWGMPPSLVELAPNVLDYWYRAATANDCFVAPTTGMGYMYPSRFDNLSDNAFQLNHLMQKADLHNLVISDSFWPTDLNESSYAAVGSVYAGLEAVRGLFYLDVNGDYARYAGRILWFDHKPMVTCKYTLWDGAQYEGLSRTPEQLAATLNSQPRSPYTDTGSYSFVIVHAWSYTFDDVVRLVSLLDPQVRVVTPEELIEQLYLHLRPCAGVQGDGDLDGDCQVTAADLDMLAADWLSMAPNLPADDNGDGKVDLGDFRLVGGAWMN